MNEKVLELKLAHYSASYCNGKLNKANLIETVKEISSSNVENKEKWIKVFECML